ncbi:unnamed protein product, partial [Penicillium nalgiovense]
MVYRLPIITFDSSETPLRSCRPCYYSKTRCNREVPHCQTCLKRGKPSLCVYETKMPDQKRALPEPQPKRQNQEQEGEYEDNHIPWKTFELQSEQYLHHESSTSKEMQHAIEPHLMRPPPKSIAAANAEKALIFQPKHVEETFERPRSTSVPQPTEPYAQMNPPASLPPTPNFDLTISGRHVCGPHTTHQLLLKVICRRHRDWEESFVLQHEQLQQWLISVRNALTNSDGLHTVTLEDIERQTRYILVSEARNPHTGRFGVRASIALICHVFGEIQADELEGYESKGIWTRDQNFLSIMASRLKKSPLFGAEISVNHLQSMILGLQKAFQCEEIRVSGMEFRTLRIESQLEVLGYYRQAFLAFNPMLSPKILASLKEANDLTTLLWHYQLTNM